MPLYDYECQNCKKVWEDVYSFETSREPESKPCPHCEKIGYVRKIISVVTNVDPVVVRAGSKIDPGLRNRLDGMRKLYPKMKWDLGN